MGLSIYDEHHPFLAQSLLQTSDGIAVVTIVAAQLVPYRIDAVLVSSDDTASRTISFKITLGAENFQLGNVVIPAGTGFAGILPVDIVSVQAPAAIAGYVIPPGYLVKANLIAAMTAGKYMYFCVLGGYV